MPEAGAGPCRLGVVEDNLLVKRLVRCAERGIVNGQKGQLCGDNLGDGGGRHSSVGRCARSRGALAGGGKRTCCVTRAYVVGCVETTCSLLNALPATTPPPQRRQRLFVVGPWSNHGLPSRYGAEIAKHRAACRRGGKMPHDNRDRNVRIPQGAALPAAHLQF